MPRRFLILHGWEGSGPEHWQSWLAERLRAAGEVVAYPALPDPYAPRLGAWLRALDAERVAAAVGQTRVVCSDVDAWDASDN